MLKMLLAELYDEVLTMSNTVLLQLYSGEMLKISTHYMVYAHGVSQLLWL